MDWPEAEPPSLRPAVALSPASWAPPCSLNSWKGLPERAEGVGECVADRGGNAVDDVKPPLPEELKPPLPNPLNSTWSITETPSPGPQTAGDVCSLLPSARQNDSHFSAFGNKRCLSRKATSVVLSTVEEQEHGHAAWNTSICWFPCIA